MRIRKAQHITHRVIRVVFKVTFPNKILFEINVLRIRVSKETLLWYFKIAVPNETLFLSYRSST